jgi:protein SCO1/2
MNGNIYIADFFFTNCPSICPVMTKNMAYVQKKLSVYPNIKFLSHTVDPLNDSPQRFNEYINEMRIKNINIDESNWDFVTGEKEEIYDVATSYFVNVSADSLAPGGFLHSEYFVLVDKEGRIRSGIDKNGNVVGVYDGTNEAQLRDLINDVKVLMAEYKRPTKN